MMNKEQIVSILSDVKDPEIPVISIAELGILRGVDISGDRILVRITPTYSGCPAMETIREDIRSTLSKHGLHRCGNRTVTLTGMDNRMDERIRKAKTEGLWHRASRGRRMFATGK